MLYVITGATGHIGNNIVRLLLSMGERVRVLVRRESDPSLEGLEVERRVGALDNVGFLLENIERGCCVIHCAGMIALSERDSEAVYHANVDITCNIVQACMEKEARLVYVSSVDAISAQGRIVEPECFYPDELVGCYARSKAIASNYALKKTEGGLDGCVVCPSAVIGDNDFKVSCVGQVIKDYIDRMPLAYIKGGYNFVSVSDVAKGCVLAAEKGQRGKCYLLTGEYMSVKDMFLCLNGLSGKKHLPPYLPFGLVYFLAPVLGLYYTLRGKRPVFSRYALTCLGQDKQYCCEETKKALGYSFKSARETVKESYDYFIKLKE
ncbi:MAG: NAD-dependent epimerase/dehydratase family protein [Clostridia bacterium]|nr:NAD-dependent epimerase/dehydratase family protein [Clostridia bacterium]